MTTPVQILPAPAAPAAPAVPAGAAAPSGAPFAAALAVAGAAPTAPSAPDAATGAAAPATSTAAALPTVEGDRPAPDVLALLRATLGQLGTARAEGTAGLAADASALLRAALGLVGPAQGRVAGTVAPAVGAAAEVGAVDVEAGESGAVEVGENEGEELSRTLGALLAAVRPTLPGLPVQRDSLPTHGRATVAAAAEMPATEGTQAAADAPLVTPTIESSAPVDEAAALPPTTTTTDASRAAPAPPDVATAGDHGPAGTAATGTDATSQPRVSDRVAGPVGDPSPRPTTAAEVEAADAPPTETSPAPDATAATRVRPELADAPRPVQVDPAAAADVTMAPQIDDLTGVTTARTPAARSDTGLASQVAARVEAAVQALENAPPPRDVTLEIEGMRLQVRLRGDVVRVSGDTGLPAGWDADLRSSLAERGFQLGQDGGDGSARGESGGRGSDQRAAPLPAPEGSPAHARSARSARARGDDLRM